MRNGLTSPISYPIHGEEHAVVIMEIFLTARIVRSCASPLLLVLLCQPLYEMTAMVIKVSHICIVPNKKKISGVVQNALILIEFLVQYLKRAAQFASHFVGRSNIPEGKLGKICIK